MWKKIIKDEKGFTGLEAAIVLVAFVVVAAVFSYVMLGAGFFTTQKSQEVVHTGVTQASSSVELSGNVIATGNLSTPGSEKLQNVTMFLQLTSGGSPVDMNKTLIVFSAPGVQPKDLTLNVNSSGAPVNVANATRFAIVNRYNTNGNENLLIDKFEKFEIQIDVDAVAGPSYPLTANKEFQLEIKPPQGATYTIRRQAPPAISNIMTLV